MYSTVIPLQNKAVNLSSKICKVLVETDPIVHTVSPYSVKVMGFEDVGAREGGEGGLKSKLLVLRIIRIVKENVLLNLVPVE